ncbi:MAG: sugar phosphate isomerase/epimerase [Clostridia bacterium]|nr:sugar phosphate isomerase/epimerase [Clostridia bacterium]
MRKISTFFAHLRELARQEGWPLEAALDYARELGVCAVDIDSIDIDDATQLGRMLEKAGLEVSSICFMFDGDAPALCEKNRHALEAASVLHPRTVMPIPGFFRTQTPEGRREERMRAIAVEKALVAEILALGLIPTMEDYDHALSPIGTLRGMQDFLEAIPELQVAFDTGNFRFSGVEVMEAFFPLRSRIRHVHCKDRLILSRREEAFAQRYGEGKDAVDGACLYPCACGRGNIPIGAILDLLCEDGFQGYLSAEFFGSAHMRETLRHSAAFLSMWTER